MVEIKVGIKVNRGRGGWRFVYEVFWFVSQFPQKLMLVLRNIVS